MYPDAYQDERAKRLLVSQRWDMPRPYGYAPVGQRCSGKQGWHAKGRVNVIGAIVATCMLSVALFTGSTNADVFYAWVTQDLLPKLPAKPVIVMDNAVFHKRLDIQEVLEKAGHALLYLPPYESY